MLCLFLYISLVFISEYIIGVSINLKTFITPLLIISAFFAALFLNKLCNFICRQWNFKEKPSKKECIIWFIAVFTISLSVLLVYYYAFFPGALASGDPRSQLLQATNKTYNDWHPFIHTLLFYIIPMKIFRAKEVIVFLQLLYFSLGFSYLIMTIRKFGCFKSICAICVIFVILVPITGNILMYPFKDCGLAIFSMVSVSHYINIVMTKNKWLEKKSNIFVCSLFWALTVLMRHNAILFIFPIIIAVSITGRKNKKRITALILCFVSFLLLCKGPLYKFYNVEKPSRRLVESVGICMTIMGNVVTNYPESMDSEVLDFLYRVSPKETWERSYVPGSFNYVKRNSSTDLTVIEKEGLKNILKYTVKTFKSSLIYSIQGFFKATGMVWQLSGDLTWAEPEYSYIDPFLSMSDSEISLNTEKQQSVRTALSYWKTTVDKSLLRYPANCIGYFNLVLIALALTGIKKWRDLLCLLHAMPLLCYNFGTALLLTGFDWRFFYLNFPIFIPAVFLLIKCSQEKEKA